MTRAYFIEYKGQKRIAVEFPNREDLRERFKKLSGREYSWTLKVWHLPDTDKYRKMFGLPLHYQEILPNQTIEKIEEYKNWLKSKRYSENTIRSYLDCVKTFFNFFKNKSHELITNDDIIHFNTAYIVEKKLSFTYQNQFVNSLKLFYQITENKKIDVNLIHRPRTERKLPKILSKEEIKAIFDALPNLKHRAMLSLIYACGLRSGELLNIKFHDINRDRLTLHVFQAKGNKDRIVPLSPKILEMLEEYYKFYRPKEWLFEGQYPGTQYSSRSLQNVLKYALEKAKIKKQATLHWLRHSYATHLLENGVDIRYIQELLGHKSSRTTEIYTHVSTRDIEKIKSPFDSL